MNWTLASLAGFVTWMVGMVAVGSASEPGGDSGTTVTVTTTADSGSGSLRAAIETLNSTAGGTIDLQSVSGPIFLESPLPEVQRNLVFQGPATGELQINGQGKWPIFSFAAGTTSELSRLVLTNALATGYRHGAAISNAGMLVLRACEVSGNKNEYGWGGGLYNRGDLSLYDCALRTNVVVGEATGGNYASLPGPEILPTNAPGSGLGGAIYHERGLLYASNCLIALNRVVGGDGGKGEEFRATEPGPSGSAFYGGSAMGGGLFARTGVVSFVQCRFESNRAEGGAGGRGSDFLDAGRGGSAQGGGAAVLGAEATFDRCRWADNESQGGAGGVAGIGSYNAARGGLAEGGGLFLGASAKLDLEAATVSSNRVLGGLGGYARDSGRGGAGHGAGLSGWLHRGAIRRSLFQGNRAVGGDYGPGGPRSLVAEGGNAVGGGMRLEGGVDGLVENCTFSANSVEGRDTFSSIADWSPQSGFSLGGGLAVADQDAATSIRVRFCTFAQNETIQSDVTPNSTGTKKGVALGGGFYSERLFPDSVPPRVSLAGVVFWGNRSARSPGGDGLILSLAPNLFGDDSELAGVLAHDLVGLDPRLGPLQDNGGPTWTHALSPGSPALDRIAGSDVPVVDQRGELRPAGNGLDLGAFELQVVRHLVVTSTADTGAGSLRAAIETLNGALGGTIDLQSVTGAILLESPLPEVQRNLALQGPTTGEFQISGQGKWPIFSFAAGTTNKLSRLVLTNALATGYRNGGAISNAGTLALADCVLSGNRNEGGWGGAIYNRGDLSLDRCFLRDNQARGEAGGDADSDGTGFRGHGAGGGGAGMGGAIFHDAGQLTVTSSLFAANGVVGGKGGDLSYTLHGSGQGGGPEGGEAATQNQAAGDGGFGSGGGGAFAASNYSAGQGGFGGGHAAQAGATVHPDSFAGGRPAFGYISGAGGGAGMGGAIYARTGVVSVAACIFEKNQARGGDGGVGVGSAGGGGGAMGGAILNQSADLDVRSSQFLGNQATGGSGAGPTDNLQGEWTGAGGPAEGAGVWVMGGKFRFEESLAVSNVVIGGAGGRAKNGGAGGVARGGVVAGRGGQAEIQRSLFQSNHVLGGPGGSAIRFVGDAGDALGGAGWVGGGSLFVENSTFSGNLARGADSQMSIQFNNHPVGSSFGGALAIEALRDGVSTEARIRFCTIVSNEIVQANWVGLFSPPSPYGDVRGGGVFTAVGSVQLEGVILAGNYSVTNADVSGAFAASRFNLVENLGAATGFDASNLVGVSLKLGPLQDNGGSLWSHALLSGSPALDVYAPADGPAIDQRGFARPAGALWDLGAFELTPAQESPLRWVAVQLLPDRSLEVKVGGSPSTTYTVEFSEDFKLWTPTETVVGGAVFRAGTDRPAGYYRLRTTVTP